MITGKQKAKGWASMARAQHHYMADWFYPDTGAIDGFRKESDRIVAYDDAEAIRESSPIGRETPSFFRVRKVTRTSNVVIFDSRQGQQDNLS
jgi:hypothetical protein